MFSKLTTARFFVVLMFGSFTFLHAQERTVRGTVTDAESGEPLPGATVFLLGTTIGTTTNPQGIFSIRAPAAYNTLQFSFVGYKTQKVNIESKVEINIQLQRDPLQLDETVVVGYGTLSRREITNAIVQVSRDEIGDLVPRTVDQAIQGRVTGVQLTNTSGLLGAPTSTRIRGAASISAATRPLYIVDGVAVTNPPTAGSSSVGQGAGGGGIDPLLNLDPNDIESYQVLKDASTTIYGSRGANGVVLITTRQGKQGTQVVNIRTSGGSVKPTKVYEMMNGEQFTRIWNDAAVNRFGSSGGGLLLPTDNIVNTNWMDIVRQTGAFTENSASVAGGTERTRYYVGGTYRSEEGFVRGNLLKRYSGRAHLDHAVSDQIRIGINLNPSRTDNYRVYTENAVASVFTYAALYYPNVPARNADGSLNLSVAPNRNAQFNGTPLSNVEGIDFKSSLTQLISQGTLQWNILQNLVFDTKLGVELWQLTEKFKRGTKTTDGFPDGNAFSSNDQYVNYSLNSTVTYTDQVGDHKYSVLAGIDAQRSQNTAFSAFARGFPSDLLKNISSAATPVSTTGTGTDFSFLGYFSRISYSYKDRYLLSLSGRIDGSSRFGKDVRYAKFPAVSGGWIVSDESWFKSVPVIDFFKLRGAIGKTGNAEIGNFPALGLVSFGFNYNDLPGAAITQLENPILTWEKASQYDGGVDFGILGQRVRGSIGYYVKNTTALLLNVPVSRVNGFTTFTQNLGEMENRGWEFDVTADILHGGNLRWTMSANVSTVNNKVTKLVGQIDPITGRRADIIFGRSIVREGEPLGAWYVVRYKGPDPANGNATWLDLNGDVTSTYSLANRVIAGSPWPDYFGGFTNSFAFGPFDATVFFQFTKGNKIYRADGGFTDSNLNSLFNQSTRQLDYWRPDNPNAANPQPRLLQANGSQASSRYLEDGSYLRLKQVTIGYTLPASLLGSIRARIYAQGVNLWTSTKFLGMDPEAASTGNIQASDIFFQLPQAKTIVLGLDLTL